MKLLKHQQRFKEQNPHSKLVCWEGGTGKTIGACVWLSQGRDDDALVVCPKKVVRKWQNELTKWNTKATVVSKEEFKKLPIKKWSAKVIDEADEFASPLFVAKKRSQLSSKLYELTRAYPNIPTLLLTATPVRSNPWNLHTLLCFVGLYIDWKKWRDTFFSLQHLPYLPRPAYMPKNDWRTAMRPILEKYSDIVLMKDCVNELPAITEEKIFIKTEKYVKKIDEKLFFDEHRWEQQNKAKEIINIGRDFRKVFVVAYYREQIEQLRKELSKDRETFVIYGGVKDQEKIIEQAQKSDECYFIVQSGIGAGFDGDSFSCMVFASMGYAVRDFCQMNWRVRRINNLHPIYRYYLIGGRCDLAVLRNIEMGKDFIPSEWCEENVTRTTKKK